ncbi:MAG: T9SS type A sorting domain-containing protein [Bacteroidia bacterium]|nr:T9SS type A sorting domain-containing protein [Bacteroidia bacterium]
MYWSDNDTFYNAVDSVIQINSETDLYYIEQSDTVVFNNDLYFFDTASSGYILLHGALSCRSDSLYVKDTLYNYISNQLFWLDTAGYHRADTDVVSVNYEYILFFETDSGDTAIFLGNLYYHNFTSEEYILISAPFSATDSLFLSFYYQPQGFGFAPEEHDSLVVEFYASRQNRWHKVWGIKGTGLQPFQQTLIHINDTAYFHEAFQFRFRNYASLAETSIPSFAGNNDVWNIDAVYLNENRGIYDTCLNDVAFLIPLTSTLKDYEAMPWLHFKHDDSQAVNMFISLFFNYSDSVGSAHYQLYYDLINKEDSIYYLKRDLGAEDIYPYDIDTLGGMQLSSLFDIEQVQHDSALFEIKAYLQFDNLLNEYQKWNDTVRYSQKFYNYYAYDDGTAEGGWGLANTGTENGRVACKFYIYKPDTLQAVQMYFNQTINDANKKYFYLTIWKDNNGLPGNIIYQREGELVEYGYGLNDFHTYQIQVEGAYYDISYITVSNGDSLLVINDTTIFVGWQKIYTEDMLNVGVDKNKVHNEKVFYSYSGNWNQAQILQGSLMIRPVFGKTLPVSVREPEAAAGFMLYPNPADNQLNIKFTEEFPAKEIKVYLFNSYGEIVHCSTYLGKTISTVNLPNGVYLLKITDHQSIHFTGKVIIIH